MTPELETASGMAAALAARSVSSAELVERAFARAHEWQPTTNAIVQWWEDAALVEAQGWDDARASGEPVPALAGIPVLVKELYDVAGRETTGCCRAYADRIATADAPTIERVRAAGLVMIGKTNQHELAFGGTNRYSSFGPTANPWNPDRMTGGSSGGSAAAVASGVVPWALGSDTGGSIRIPSSFCGTVGLKPTTGRIPIDGMLPLAPSLDTPGPIAGTVEDAGTLWRVLAGLAAEAPRSPDERDRAGAAARVGIVGGYYAELVHPDVQSGVASAAAALEAAGATLTDVDGHGIDDARRIWNTICSAEFVEAHRALRGRWDEVLDPSIREDATEAEGFMPEVRSKAAVRRQEISRWFHDRLDGVDALLVPTTGYPAQAFEATTLPAGPARPIDLTRVGPGWFTCPANLSGLPAISVPAGRSADGLPFGVTLIGHDDAEETLLSLAAII